MPALIEARREIAAVEFGRRVGPSDAEAFVVQFSTSLTQLRDLLLQRIHEDIQTHFGVDSMLAPMSASEEHRELFHAKVEIELYSIATAADEIAGGGYLDRDVDRRWLLDWLLHLRLGDRIPHGVAHRLSGYRKRSAAARRLLFSDLLVHSFPEAQKAPLVVFRLYPKAVRLAVAAAFDDPLRAAELRNEQIRLLPAISDCRECHGRPLESGASCPKCGNPLWRLTWMLAAD